ncbi:nicotinate (nicotinamide) nucleotide adenylyltransferase [Luteolibacter pohnpeiensis]|uniref:Probable nicotinate-nucleotide adenylyltransferase n=1 Tax=Luteolibacter pohnpeiensis TaxID=454153 RepID=A0A934S478_9BACT|nr:nicotinate (nicotinamide) nucleotide adenylyltransferase [Luteolibacter pohnpeiensis]MBK1880905.1 nicotinate (nicotinamide) nucleotide adenylyltransferase [Luteolibacter pohnpeiensis]
MSTLPRKIALFGGTFDPVHLGHLHLATLAWEALGLDEVRFIPCKISPHKTGTHPASPEDRLKMLQLATADLPWAVVDDIELTSGTPNFSYRTAEEIQRQQPDAELYWIMGGDQWAALPRWKHPEKLAAIVQFIVLARDDAPAPREGFRFHLVHGEHPASATQIREAIAAGRSSDDLPRTVAAYIRDHGLYPFSPG